MSRRAFVDAAKSGAHVRGYTWTKPHTGDRGWRGVRVLEAADKPQGDTMFK
jgi:hypothetical protein